jgi:hypothetical protein
VVRLPFALGLGLTEQIGAVAELPTGESLLPAVEDGGNLLVVRPGGLLSTSLPAACSDRLWR